MKISLSRACTRASARTSFAILFVGILAAGHVAADPPAPSSSGNEPQERSTATTGPVALPSREAILQDEYLRNALSRSSEGLTSVRHADGSISVDLQGRFQSISVARIGRDGRVETACMDNHASLADFFAAHPEADTAGAGHRAGVEDE